MISLVESGRSVDTHRIAGVSLAVFENTRTIVAWHIPTTTHDIVNVLAQLRSFRALPASPEAELGCGHEVRPLMQLLQLTIIECAGEDQATDGVAVSSGAVRI